MCFYDPLELYYVLVVHLIENCHLTIGSLCINIVLKSIEDLLESILFASCFVDDLPDLPIGSTPHELLKLESCEYMILDFFTH